MKNSENSKYTPKEALSIVTRICSREEKCLSDIKEKLYKWGISETESENILQFLLSEKYIDETRYAAHFVNDKVRFNKWGQIKIAYILKQKAIPEEIINDALNNFDDEKYFSIIKDELFKKFKSLKDKDVYVLKTKMYRFGASRGFESELIKKAINEIIDNK